MYFKKSDNPDPDKDMIVQDFNELIYADSRNECLNEDYNFAISKPHSSAFVDINGDCINDILIHSMKGTSRYLEFWIGKKAAEGEIKYCLKDIKSVPDNFGIFSITDVNNDGHLDLIFPIKDNVPPAIFVAYNKKKFDYDWTKNYCESVQSENNNSTINEILFDEFDKEKITNVHKNIKNLINNLVYK